jgi:hypothetical protein
MQFTIDIYSGWVIIAWAIGIIGFIAARIYLKKEQ